MKKISTIILCMIFALGASVMAGCNEGSVYDGNYSQVQKTQMDAFAQSVTDANEEGEQKFDFSKGFSIKYEMKNRAIDMSMELLTNVTGETKQLYADVSMETIVSKVDMETWYKDGYSFVQAEIHNVLGEGTTSVKGKAETDFDSALGEMMEAISVIEEIDFSILGLLEAYGETMGIKFYIDDSSEQKKCKIELPETNLGDGMYEICIVLVYDANYKLYAIKYEIEGSVTTAGKTETNEIKIEIMSSSKSVSYPKDIDNVDAWKDDLSGLESIL